MGKKAASPEPVPDQPADDGDQEEQVLTGEWTFPDGSEYSGQYLKKGDQVCMHGEGKLTTGPEVFEGVFEKGAYKEGTYTGANGSVYKGKFLNSMFHGPGEYAWPDGRMYRGMWKEGVMHGRGCLENFSFGVDRIVTGFSVNGRFASDPEGQDEAKREFLEEYGVAYSSSATAVMRDLATKLGPGDGGDAKGKKASPGEEAPPAIPEELLVAPVVPQEDGVEPGPEAAERDAVERLVSGPYPEATTLKLSTLQAFLALFAEDAEQPGKVTLYEEMSSCERFEGRLKSEQLQHTGQGVEFWAPDAEPGSVGLMVLVNISTEQLLDKVQWKIVHVQDVPMPAGEDSAPAAEEPPKKGKK